MRQPRGGGAIPLVMVMLVIVFPLVAALFVRSQAAVTWVSKLNSQQAATALAEEGEAAALDGLRAGGGVGTGSRPTADGGMHWWTFALPRGAGGQDQYLVAGEGVFLGEERLVLSVAESTVTSGAPLVITRDRGWIYPGPGGGVPLDQTSLTALENQRIGAYLNQLSQESAITTSTFISRMFDQSQMLSCPEIGPAWSTISSELASAKAPPVP